MAKESITLIIVGILGVMSIVQAIFRMKYKRDMFIEYLKHYDDGTSYLSDDIIKKIFKIESEDGE